MNFHSSSIEFEKLNTSQVSLINKWLSLPHVQEFWDNSPEHRKDIKLFADGRKKPSAYFNGAFSYWMGSYEKEPFAFLMTSRVSKDEDIPSTWKEHLPEKGMAYGLDFCIGNTNYLGKGYGAVTLRAFMSFFKDLIDPKVSRFLIDPDIDNPRAIHVYQKAGFHEVSTFEVESGYFENHSSKLMIQDI